MSNEPKTKILNLPVDLQLVEALCKDADEAKVLAIGRAYKKSATMVTPGTILCAIANMIASLLNRLDSDEARLECLGALMVMVMGLSKLKPSTRN